MRYRQLGPTGDYIFGTGTRFLVNSPEAVAQAIKTRMRLLVNEWFLDTTEGLDVSQILGTNTATTRDFAVKSRILGTKGVKSLVDYSSSVDANRRFTVTATVDTIYGAVLFSETF